ncbi:RNA recognition motif domain [Trinorchestia longiramus]|nr:RNA recognition motif domain [Trinorchestia longiramus]
MCSLYVRHKSRRKRRRQSSSSSSRSRSSSYSRRRRRRRRSFSPARSRSRSRSSGSYSYKKRSGKRSRYNSRSRSRSFSPNTVYSVGCACGGGDPKFVGHLPSCQHYSPGTRYPTPEITPPPPHQYYHPAQYHYKSSTQYGYRPYYYDCNAGPPQDFSGTYMHGRRSETDAFIYGRTNRPNPVSEQNLRAKQVEERLVVYVGRIVEGTTKDALRERFKKFGTITDISLHFRDRGDNYGFVTFTNSEEANRAIENGNKEEELHYDLCFGGRRQFCRQQYKDLDALPGADELNQPSNDFDSLLREMLYRR